MDVSQKVPMASPQLVKEAETLIRSLAGVTYARVHASGSAIDAIHVDVSDPDQAAHVAAHVRSALLAGLATPVTPARIHVRVREHDDLAPQEDTTAETDAGPQHRLRLVQDAEATDRYGTRSRTVPGAQPAPTTPTSPPDHEPITARPRLVAVDLDRSDDGRVRCTVTVAYGTDVHRAHATAVDLPGAAAQAAAQASVRALIQAGIHGLELDGLREVEIAGRDYVVVALRRAEHYTRIRSGSAPITGAPERAAALAAVVAARGMT